MKKCPYCAGEVQDAAVKCKHCHKVFGNAGAVNLSAFATQKPIEQTAAYALKRWTRRLVAVVFLFFGVVMFFGSLVALMAQTPFVAAMIGSAFTIFAGLLLIDRPRDVVTKLTNIQLTGAKRGVVALGLVVVGTIISAM